MQRILAVAVHPDDETLGCGGTLLRLRAEGAELHWLIVTAMTTEAGFGTDAIERREREVAEVARMFGFASVQRLGFPAARLDEVPLQVLVRSMARAFAAVAPTMVILPFQRDVHTDHQRVFSAGYSCSKVFRCPSIRKIVMAEVLSETDYAAPAGGGFVPNLFVDISGHLEQKLEILRVYAGEVQPHPFPRSEEGLRALATLRGAAAGCRHAEGFVVVKEIV